MPLNLVKMLTAFSVIIFLKAIIFVGAIAAKGALDQIGTNSAEIIDR